METFREVSQNGESNEKNQLSCDRDGVLGVGLPDTPVLPSTLHDMFS